MNIISLLAFACTLICVACFQTATPWHTTEFCVFQS